MEVYRVRRKFQWNEWVFSVPGPCACVLSPGSDIVSSRVDVAGQYDSNPCMDITLCTGQNATDCNCANAGYCGMGGGGGSCGIKPYMYAGDIWFVNEGDPRKEHILKRRFVIYDPTLPSYEELIKQEKYKSVALGRPNPDIIYFPPGGESIEGLESVSEKVKEPVPAIA